MNPETATIDPLRDFRAHLSRRVNTQLRDTGRAAVLVHRAVYEHGWTVEALAKECMRDHHGAVNAAAIVMHRLEHCADHPPADLTGAAKTVHPAGTCPCRGEGLLYDESTIPPTVTLCPGQVTNQRRTA